MLGYNEKDLASLNAAVLSGNITDDTELVVSDPNVFMMFTIGNLKLGIL